MKNSSANTTKAIGIIGCGGRVRGLARRLQEARPGTIRTVAVYDPDPRSVHAARDTLNPDLVACDTAAELLERPDITWVMIGSSNAFHREHVLSAFRAGKHVFCEKPLAITIEACLEMRDAWKASGRQFFFGLCLRYSPFYRKIREIIDGGGIGDLVSFEFNETLDFNHGGYIMGNWRRLRKNAGTHLLEKCCHDIDIANWLTGSLAARVASFGGLDFYRPENARHIERLGTNADGKHAYQAWPDPNRVNPFTGEKDIVDNQVLILEYANRVRAAFHTNGNAALPERRISLNGSEGAIRGDAREGRVEFRRIGFDEPTHVYETGARGGHAGGDERMILDLAACILDGTPSPTGMDEGIRAAVTCFGADAALDKGTVEDLAPLWKKAGVDPEPAPESRP